MATITIIGATIITAIAIGKTHRLVAASKLVIAFGQGLQHMLRPFPCQHLCIFPCPNDHYRSGGREVSASAVPAHGGVG
jgi:hypothetical protein